MSQIFVFGASIAYGVGAEKSGWADLLKQSLHAKMYGDDGVGEEYELYNFSQPGAQVEFVIATYVDQLRFYRRSGKVIALVETGGNNTKAIDNPTNYVSSLEEYEQLMRHLLTKLQKDVDELIVLPSLPPVDESKTNPDSNPLTGEHSYFTNDRIIMFNHTLMKLCDELGITYIDIDISPEEWVKNCQYKDGLHPNQAGHQYIFEKVSKVVEGLL